MPLSYVERKKKDPVSLIRLYSSEKYPLIHKKVFLIHFVSKASASLSGGPSQNEKEVEGGA